MPASYLIYQSKKRKVIVPLDYRSEIVYLFIKVPKGPKDEVIEYARPIARGSEGSGKTSESERAEREDRV